MSDVVARVASAEELYDLRTRVLRAEAIVPVAFDPRDAEPSTLHVAGFVARRLVVCASLYHGASAATASALACQLRYLATEPDVRGRGFARDVLDFAESLLVERGVEALWANARDTALEFYRLTGWQVVEGSAHVSTETGLDHHVVVKWLTEAAA